MKLYENGTILTMEDNMTVEAVLEDNGKIIAAGKRNVIAEAAGQAQRIDLQGRTMMPAFIDAHSHFSGYANALLQVPLDDAHSFTAIAQKLSQFVQENHIPEGTWVTARGYDHNQLQEKRHFDRQLLDQACPNYPVVVQHRSGHSGIFSTMALKQLGIDEHTKAPDGGKIEKVDGRLTGYMEENAFLQYLKKMPMRSAEEILTAFEQTQKRYASYGITTVQDGMMVDLMTDMYDALLQSDKLYLDVVGYLDIADSEKLKQRFAQHILRYHRHFKIGGYKIFLDGSPQSRTAWMRTAYQGSAEKGYPTLTSSEVEVRIKKAVDEKMQILAHCNGDAAAEQYLQALSHIDGEAAVRPVMIHAQLLGRDQLCEVKKLGVIPSFFIGHVWHWGDVHIQNFGIERASYISPAHSAEKKGILFTFHQDAPVIEPDMLETIWCAVNRITKNGVLLGREEQISVLEALKAVTIHAAYQYFEEDTKGSIREGKQADFVILDRNPLAVDKQEIRNIHVIETIKDGKTIYTR